VIPSKTTLSMVVTESLTTDLSRIRWCHSSLAYPPRLPTRVNPSISNRSAASLNVRYVLEGSVQRAATGFRVNVQLISAETGSHVWAERFDKPIADLFDMQDEIVSRLANNVKCPASGR